MGFGRRDPESPLANLIIYLSTRPQHNLSGTEIGLVPGAGARTSGLADI